jgi:hypothetical protein
MIDSGSGRAASRAPPVGAQLFPSSECRDAGGLDAVQQPGPAARGPKLRLNRAPLRNPTTIIYGGSYLAAQSIQPPQVLPEPLALPGACGPGAWRSDLHGHGKPQAPVRAGRRHRFSSGPFPSTGCTKRPCATPSASSRYDLIAVDLPWIGEFVKRASCCRSTTFMDTDGWIRRFPHRRLARAHWGGALWRAQPDHARAAVLPQGPGSRGGS